MPLVIADASPINYLILIRQIEILPRLFERVVIPRTVRNELGSPSAPPLVRDWIADLLCGWRCSTCRMLFSSMNALGFGWRPTADSA